MLRAGISVLAGLALSLAAAPAFAGCIIGKIAELPVTMAGMQPLVPVQINGVDEMLMADSGAFYSTLSPAVAKEIKLSQTMSNLEVLGVGGSSGFANIGTAKTLTLAHQVIPDAEFVVAPSSSAAGVLGQDILGLADVEYDLANGVIRIFKPKDCADAALAYWAKGVDYSAVTIEPLDRLDAHTIGEAFVNGVKIKVVFDTGAGTSTLTRAAAERVGIKLDAPDVKVVGYTTGFGSRAVKDWIAPATSFKVGDEEIRNTRLHIGDFGMSSIRADMLLGADFFLPHRVYVSNAQHKLYFTYNGGPVFRFDAPAVVQADANEPPAVSGDAAGNEEPKDADGYARRGAAFAARRDFDHAIADTSKACELAPTEPKYFFQRANIHAQNKQPALAMADLDQTLKLDSKNVPALLLRARLRAGEHDKAGSAADLDAVAGLVSKESDLRLTIAAAYMSSDQFDAAISQYDQWISNHSGDGRLVQAYNGRCWARAAVGRDLNKALDDCNRAVNLSPKAAAILDSRGLVELRLGDNDKAIADYDAALALQPKLGWSLYGRGLAKMRKGQKTDGAADLTAATAINPKLPDLMKTYGIVGPDGA